jgi:threonyl-tRNA synthetase
MNTGRLTSHYAIFQQDYFISWGDMLVSSSFFAFLIKVNTMLKLTLADNSTRDYPAPITALQLATDIGPGLAKAAVAAKVDGQIVDLSYVLSQDSSIEIITGKDAAGLEIIRHSCAHLLAQAVKRLYPSAQVTIGPVIDNGFYYDFAFERSFTPDDRDAIEAEMVALAKQDFTVSRRVVSRAEALEFFRERGEHYKAQVIEAIPDSEPLSLYTQGDFTDLCRGPHVPRTGMLKAFKLTKLSGAFWRGDSSNEMLQRIYGTAWADKKALQGYLTWLEEAELRDHRRLGKQMNWFHFQEEAPGMPFWHTHGWTLFRTVEQYIRDVVTQYGYQEIRTPMVAAQKLWEQSGHWDKFRGEMFTTHTESQDYAIKPMNCPGHVQVFNQGLKSYRDLPLRLAEFGSCHRREPSGTLHGLMRLRAFVQDDAHIFCTEAQLPTELASIIDLVFQVYRDFGFEEVQLKLSTRPEQRVGSDAMWDTAEQVLQHALESKGLAYELLPGEGAFYGPKIEFSLLDCLARVWQCGTVQIDFSMPERLHASYVAEDGSKQTPVMVHRAILGSLERFIGILIEHHAGLLPLWLAPIQVVACNISDKQAEYTKKVTTLLQEHGIRANFDLRNEKIGFKIRHHSMQRIPYLLVIGDREVESELVAVRTQSGKDMGDMSLSAFVDILKQDIESMGRG